MANVVERAQGSRGAGGMSETAPASPYPARYSRRGVEIRLFLTCWILYALHFSPFVTRELYLTMALVEDHSLHVDKYLGLHADLFPLNGRGYMGGNPGISILAAVPYALALPVVNRVAPVRPPKPGEAVQAETEETRGPRRAFYLKARALGIEVRLGVAAMVVATLFMAPFAAAGVLVMFRLLGHLKFTSRAAFWLTLLFALGTPVFFRSAILNLNLQVALLSFWAFVLLWWPSESKPERERWRVLAAGFLAGFAVLTDYSGAIPAAALGIYAFARQLRNKKFVSALGESLWFLVGAAGPVAFLLWWQWYCYGNPWLPAQFHMPIKFYVGYETERGITWPSWRIMSELLFSPLYGLLIFMPMAALALYHFALLRRGTNRVPGSAAVFIWAMSLAYLVFCSMIEYTLRHQWIDGMRYLIVIVPFLYLLVADALASLPRGVALAVGGVSVLEMFCLGMVRENPFDSVVKAFTQGLQLPSLTALSKVATQHAPWLRGKEHLLALALYVVAALLLTIVWLLRDPKKWRAPQESTAGS